MVMGAAKSPQLLRKPRRGAPDFWESFLEKIDAPQWTDLALEEKSNSHTRDDTWFHTKHSSHQCSVQDLASSSSLGAKLNGKVSKSGYLSPTQVHSGTKSRGRTHENQAWPMKNAGRISFKLPDSKSPFNCKTRPLGEKTSCKSNSEGNPGLNSGLPKPSDDPRAKASCSGSTGSKDESKDSNHEQSESSRVVNELKNSTHEQSEPSRVSNESKNSTHEQSEPSRVANELNNIHEQSEPSRVANELNNIHEQSEPSRVADLHIQSIVPELKAAMPRTTRLLAVLKSCNLRRSHGALPAVRVEVKDERKSKDGGAFFCQARAESLMVKKGKTSSNSELQKANKENRAVRVKNQTRHCIVSPTGNGKKKLNIGSFGKCEASKTMSKDERTSVKLEIKTSDAKRQQGQSIKGSRRPLQEITNVGMLQRMGVRVQGQGFAAGEKENVNLVTDPHHKVNMEGRKKTTCGYLVQAKVKESSQPKVKANHNQLVREARKGP